VASAAVVVPGLLAPPGRDGGLGPAEVEPAPGLVLRRPEGGRDPRLELGAGGALGDERRRRRVTAGEPAGRSEERLAGRLDRPAVEKRRTSSVRAVALG